MRILASLLALTLLALASCGDNQSRLAGNESAGDPISTQILNVRGHKIEATPSAGIRKPLVNVGNDELSHLEEYKRITSSPAFDLGRMPAVPMDVAGPDLLTRTPSAIRNADLSMPFDSANATANPGSLVLSSSAGEIAFAIYRFSLAPGETGSSLSIDGMMTTSVNGEDSGVYVGLAHYTLNQWQFFQDPAPLDTPFIANLISGTPYISPANNTYVVVLTYGGDIAEITSLTLNTLSDEQSWFPEDFSLALASIGINETMLGADQIFGPGLTIDTATWASATREDLRTLLPSFWNAWYADPAGLPEHIEAKEEGIDTADTLQELLLEGIEEFPADRRIAAQTHSETLDPTDPLAQAVADLVDALGGTSDFATYQAELSAMSLADQQAIAPVLYAVIEAYNLRDTSLFTTMGFTQGDIDTLFASGHGLWLSNETFVNLIYDSSGGLLFLRQYDYVPFFEGAALIADAIDDLKVYVDTNNPTFADVSLSVDTPAGMVTIGGTGPDSHAPETNGHAFLIDLGGVDTYNCHAGATANGLNGVSVQLDMGNGFDTYNEIDDPNDMRDPSNDNTSQQGAARFGIGMLVDFGGTDDYNSVRMSQGSAVFGVGMLADLGPNNDFYTMEALGQGAAYGGVGILYEEGGADEYTGTQLIQGFGGIMGVGLLIDKGSGGDMYLARPDFDSNRPEYRSAELPQTSPAPSNVSFAQGAAQGENRGTNQTTGNDVWAAGGYGLLYDESGDDEYICGVFGQGVSLFQCLGIRLDRSGAETSSARAFAQGAAINVSAAALWDGADGDTYTVDFGGSEFSEGTPYFVALGGGFDYSLGWVFELAGNDIYNAPNLALATGVANGFGYFVDLDGNDDYRIAEANGENLTLGRGFLSDLIPNGNAREMEPTRGVFVDAAGSETYDPDYMDMLSGQSDTDPIDTPPADNVTWVRSGYPNNFAIGYRSGEQGVGRDS